MTNFFGDDDIFSEYQFHGNIKWTAGVLARIALFFSWSEKNNVTDAFTETFKRAGQLGIVKTHTTYQGFMGALTNYAHIFISTLILRLQQRMKEIRAAFRDASGFVLIAFDGGTQQCFTNAIERTGVVFRQRQKESCRISFKRHRPKASGMDHIAVEYGIATALGLASGAIRFQRTWSCSGDGQRGEVSQKHLVWGGMPGLLATLSGDS